MNQKHGYVAAALICTLNCLPAAADHAYIPQRAYIPPRKEITPAFTPLAAKKIRKPHGYGSGDKNDSKMKAPVKRNKRTHDPNEPPISEDPTSTQPGTGTEGGNDSSSGKKNKPSSSSKAVRVKNSETGK